MRVRLAAVAATLFSLVTALPALAQTADSAAPVPAGSVENVIPIGVWIWILVGTGIATVGFAAFGSTIGNGKR